MLIIFNPVFAHLYYGRDVRGFLCVCIKILFLTLNCVFLHTRMTVLVWGEGFSHVDFIRFFCVFLCVQSVNK